MFRKALILFFAILFIINTNDGTTGKDFSKAHMPGNNCESAAESTSIISPTPFLDRTALEENFHDKDSAPIKYDNEFPVVSIYASNTSFKNITSNDEPVNVDMRQDESNPDTFAKAKNTNDTYTSTDKDTMPIIEQEVIVRASTADIHPYDFPENYLVAYIPEKEWRIQGLDGRELTGEIAKKYPRGKFVKRDITNNSWGVGEHLKFAIKYGFYQAGTATMSVKEKKEVNGGLCYHIKTTAHSNDFISSFYKVRDNVVTYLDVDGLFSRRFEKKLSEGNYKSDRIVDFYHDRLIALNTKKKHALKEIPLYVQDVLSALYYIRTIDLEIGRAKSVEVYADGKVYFLKIIIHGREKVKVPAGTFSCIKIEPILESEGIFKQKGKLTIWLTDDEKKMPVKMASKVLIGSIGSILESYTIGAPE
ncbi:MAG: DUF3108 domain-containing protein [Candidatus Latescibacteria bacterium]|jgi:hypothetical protein|nr:DUF3108 domain-containing protein [Candidatus Latescibacterota bacterium]